MHPIVMCLGEMGQVLLLLLLLQLMVMVMVVMVTVRKPIVVVKVGIVIGRRRWRQGVAIVRLGILWAGFLWEERKKTR